MVMFDGDLNTAAMLDIIVERSESSKGLVHFQQASFSDLPELLVPQSIRANCTCHQALIANMSVE
jgi:hypothetical protein